LAVAAATRRAQEATSSEVVVMSEDGTIEDALTFDTS
jgi:hypothetical protein